MRGIAASPGVAIGPLALHLPVLADLPTRTLSADEVAHEAGRLDQALDQARAQLADVRDTTARRAGEDEAAIFDAHLLMLDDEELLGSIREHIAERHEAAETAVWEAAQDYRQQLLAIDDEYLKARAADLEDVATRVVAALQGRQRGIGRLDQPSIVVARDLLPSDTAGLDPAVVLGFVTEEGGPTAHTAILARQLGLPAVVGVRGVVDAVRSQRDAGTAPVLGAIDGADGTVELAPDANALREWTERQARYASERARLGQMASLPARTPDGHEVELLANLGHPREARRGAELGAVGVGLFRTEFLFLDRESAPTEDEQVAAYTEAARAYPRGYVIVRTLDVGGDKSIPYLPQAPEENPFLGLRGLRLCLAPHFAPVFKTQLRALLRAVADGAHLRIMFPMVNTVDELVAARALLNDAARELDREGIAGIAALTRTEVGAMVETPGAALTTDILSSAADFFSIGTNDLTQYVLAVDRMNSAVAPLYTSFAPAVLRAIEKAVAGAHERGRAIGMCGEMAGDPHATALLLGLGLDELSMNAPSLLDVKRVVRACPMERAHEIAQRALALNSSEEVERLLVTRTNELVAALEPS